ncbi:MAG TPA: two-component regulator propeller domain-containing protein, partial [Synergistaceae bacterium]|nr:two-component regulator propeller domain-containing protein [Synergistaceae bacterium]
MISSRREREAKGPPRRKIEGLRIWAGALALMALVAGGAEGNLSPAPPLFFTHPLHLGMEVYSLLQDRDGFLWIVTAHAGVAKYDGRKVHFLKEGPQGLSTNTVVAALEDRRGRIWIATAGGGLNVYDKDTNSVRVFRHREGDPHSLNSDTFSYKNHGNQVLLEDRAGGLWCGTLRGVSRLESDDRRGVFFTTVPFADGVPRTVYALLEDRRGKIWVGTDRGLSRLDPSRGVIETWTVGSLGELEGKAVFCLLEDRDGNVWAGGDSGLHGLLASGGVRHIPPGDPESGLPDMAI